MPLQYAICEHAYTCISGGHIVFLDLKRDKYLCLDLGATAALLPYLSGRSFVLGDSPPGRSPDAGVARTLTELEQRNLIALAPLDYAAPSFQQIASPLARQAFSEKIPAAIAARTVKGGVDAYWNDLVITNLKFLRPFLLDGHLEAAGLLDRRKMSDLLTEDQLIRAAQPLPAILSCMIAEGWLRTAAQSPSL